MNEQRARQLLESAGVFFDIGEVGTQVLNMNDVWGWATADGEEVPDSELPRLGELFFRYGWCGVLYWVSQRNDNMQSEFADVNRFIEFVECEENIRKEEPDGDKRAYLKREYVIGCTHS